MKYYDRDTGKIVDTGSVGATTSPNAGTASSMVSGAVPGVSGMQKLLGLYAIAKGNPTGAWSIMNDSTGTAGTAAEKSRAETGLTVANSISGIPKTTRTKTGSLKALIVKAKLGFPGKLGQPLITDEEKDLVDLDTRYFLLTQAVLTAVQGSRPSDYDVKSYQNSAGPNIMLPDSVNQQRIKNLSDLLKNKSGQTSL